ncbi:MAG: hypothetical protein ACRD1V_07300 [Vicinamibacterales bacterium]
MSAHSTRRIVTGGCLAAAALLVVPLGASQTAAGAQASLLVTVLASAKAPVADLTASDFKVHDGNQSIAVASAEHVTTPLAIELIVENTLPPMSAAPRTRELRTSLRAFVDAIRAGNADAKIGVFTDAPATVPVVGLNAPPADLDTSITNLTPAHLQSGTLLEALVDAGHALAEAPARRRAIVAIDFASPDPTPRAVVLNIEGAVFGSRATVWSVSVVAGSPETPQRDEMLDGLTKDSGGHRQAIVGASGLQNQLKAIANSLLSQYQIQIARPAGDLKLLKIETSKGKVMISPLVSLQ